MSHLDTVFSAPNRFTEPLFEILKRHPKRIVFPDGEDARILRVAEKMVELEIGIPILLGNREKIFALAAEHEIGKELIRVIDPVKSSDYPLFCERLKRIEKYMGNEGTDVEQMLTNPHYFAAMMLQNGQADACVAGNETPPAGVFRPLLHLIKPNEAIPHVFSATILVSDVMQHFGRDGLLFLADTNMNLDPDVEELAAIASETGQLARHFLGRRVRVALLSHSTLGSASGPSVQKVQAATALAREKVSAMDFEIDGELQADVALDAEASEMKLPGQEKKDPADVLVFPSLDAAHISMKLLVHLGGAQAYGQLIMGLTRPAAQVPRTASEEMILGTAAAVGVEAIKYRDLHQE